MTQAAARETPAAQWMMTARPAVRAVSMAVQTASMGSATQGASMMPMWTKSGPGDGMSAYAGGAEAISAATEMTVTAAAGAALGYRQARAARSAQRLVTP